MPMTVGGLSGLNTQMNMLGAQTQSQSSGLGTPLSSGLSDEPMTKSEAQAMAIGQLAESSIIQPKDESQGVGLSAGFYNSLGQMGTMNAISRGLSMSGSLDEIV